MLLREVEQQVGIIGGLADTINDPRDQRYIHHSVDDLMMQRVSQIAAGYEQELRTGSTHSQTKGTTALLKQTIDYTREITSKSLLINDVTHFHRRYFYF